VSPNGGKNREKEAKKFVFHVRKGEDYLNLSTRGGGRGRDFAEISGCKDYVMIFVGKNSKNAFGERMSRSKATDLEQSCAPIKGGEPF